MPRRTPSIGRPARPARTPVPRPGASRPARRFCARVLAVVTAVVTAVALAACGEQRSPAPAPSRAAPERVVLSLDFVPNAVHAPIYGAVEAGHDDAVGVDLEIRKPTGAPDALKLVASGRVDVGVLDIHDLAIARAQDTDLVAFGALVDAPLAALIAQPSVRRPRALEGRTVGVSGLPSDPAFLDAIVAADGGDPARVKRVTIGFSAVSRILSGRVDAAPAFWNAEGVVLRERGVDVNEFRVEDYGAPRYPEVVLITSRAMVEERPELLRRVLGALELGRRDAIARPDRMARIIARAAETRDRALVRAQLAAVAPLLAEDLALERPVLEQWADFDARIGIVDERPDVDRAFAFGLTPLLPERLAG